MRRKNGKTGIIRAFKWLSVSALAAIMAIGLHMGINQLLGNFHEVIPGELYRSAQPSGEDVADYARRYGIKTIVNLRNEARTGWYRDEASAAQKAGVTMLDFPISSDDELPQADAERLAHMMADAQKPILIHCEHGANRTGLASAIYVGAVKRWSELFADFQLSPFYGHVPIPGIGRYEMWKSWDDYEDTLSL